jgi:Mn2+/Fe2+ NRAMP family transporter
VQHPTRESLFSRIAPGLLVAATGVGVGDLAGAGFAGARLGVAILWAVVAGAVLKFAITEGVARWQLATGTTVVDGMARRLGRVVVWIFLLYLVYWSYCVGAALASACGATAHALLPLSDDADTSRVALATIHSIAGFLLVTLGGYRWFERIMGVCIAIMFVLIVAAAIAVWPGTDAVVRGLLVPSIPNADGHGLDWTLVLLGGVGGTVTVLCYGYWIREKGRAGAEGLRICRIDLGVGYAATALFGLAMVIIGSTVGAEGRSVGLIVAIADRLASRLGEGWRLPFLIGAWAAVFSSLLGVWQAVPLLFADSWRAARGAGRETNTSTTQTARWGFLIFLSAIPLAAALERLEPIVRHYGIVGAAFVPLLTAVLLLLNSRAKWIGSTYRNGWLTTVLLAISLALFSWLFFESFRG